MRFGIESSNIMERNVLSALNGAFDRRPEPLRVNTPRRWCWKPFNCLIKNLALFSEVMLFQGILIMEPLCLAVEAIILFR